MSVSGKVDDIEEKGHPFGLCPGHRASAGAPPAMEKIRQSSHNPHLLLKPIARSPPSTANSESFRVLSADVK
jgi:hypothetical protein